MIERVWFGSGPGAVAARAALWPASATFAAVAGARRALYDGGVFRVREPAIPCVSVGNLTVGGTGKTPVAAYLAARFGAQVPAAVVLRGYGDDEVEVHRRLNPGIPVVAGADRLAGVVQARAAGARIAVLDDAFQHRRVARVADIVLVSVEQVLRPRRLLPAGPWREPLRAARRADLVMLTLKSATADDLATATALVARELPGVQVAAVRLEPDAVVRLGAVESRPVSSLAGARVLAVSGIGEPDAFARQLAQLGARVTAAVFPDHHPYSTGEVRLLAAAEPDAMVVCTLKDAVKLAASWPGSRSLWYLSQRLVVEHGANHIDDLCARVIERAGSTAAG